jgi:SAM-dependent methyltransferase
MKNSGVLAKAGSTLRSANVCTTGRSAAQFCLSSSATRRTSRGGPACCAADTGLANVQFETATSTGFPGQYDLACLFDCLHDTGDPVGALRHIRQSLAEDGSLMIVEPMAFDRAEENHHYPLGRMFYSASTMICMPSSLAQPGGLASGNQLGPAERIWAVLKNYLASTAVSWPGRLRQIHSFFRNRSPDQMLATAAPWTSPCLPPGYPELPRSEGERS